MPKNEDRRRLAWSRHPQGSLVVSALRMTALCILAVARKLSRFGYSEETPSWGQVAEHFLLQLCASATWRPRPSTPSELGGGAGSFSE